MKFDAGRIRCAHACAGRDMREARAAAGARAGIR
jgi:hypothetical protein